MLVMTWQLFLYKMFLVINPIKTLLWGLKKRDLNLYGEKGVKLNPPPIMYYCIAWSTYHKKSIQIKGEGGYESLG